VVRSLTVLGLILVSACSFRTPIEYRPIAGGAEDPLTTVKLQLVDARESDAGAIDPHEIGRVRGLLGNPFPLYEAASHSVRNVTRDATVDALRLARVGVSDQSPRTLVTTLKTFWIDGYLGYKATVTVQCDPATSREKRVVDLGNHRRGWGVNRAGRTPLFARHSKSLGAYVQKATENSGTEFKDMSSGSGAMSRNAHD
jgi:hypothetical protein